MFTLHFPITYPSQAPVLKCNCPGVAHPLIDPISGEVSLVEIFPPEGSGKQLPPVPGEAPFKLSKNASVLDLLRYLKKVFEDEEALKKIPNWAVRDGRAIRAWREGKGKDIVGLGVLDSEMEENEVVSAADLRGLRNPDP